MKKKNYYCENCFTEHLKSYYEDSLGKIFCNRKCYEESLEYRDVKKEED